MSGLFCSEKSSKNGVELSVAEQDADLPMYSIDIYRTDDALLIHDKPGGWKRALPGLLLWVFGFVFTEVVAIANILNGLLALGIPFGLFFGSPYLWLLWYTYWRINGHATILIDRDSVRYEWWFSLGSHSRIYPRPETIKTETSPGSSMVGGSFGANIRIDKGWRRNLRMLLPTAAERHWLFTELARFQEEVPVALPIDEKRPVLKGSFSESESGMNVLQTLDWRGKFFQRVVPKCESVPKEKSQRGEVGVLSLRCAKCHKIVPRDHVLPDKPLAHCPDCGCVFEPQELKRGRLMEPSRLQIRRNADTLEITQKPLRTGLPLWTILLVFLFDLGIVALYFYVKHLVPDINVFELTGGKDEFDPLGFLFGLAVLHILFLALPLWTFFDRRTIHLDHETLKITGRWLFFPWKRTVSRLQVQKASFRELHSLFYNVKLAYSNRSVWIGCTTREDIEVLRGEINHFLYTVEPSQLEMASDDWEPTFLGGTESLDPEIGLHCPDCGAKFTSDTLDCPTSNAHCHSCNTTFPIDHAVAYRIEVITDKQPANITVEQTDDSLTMRYIPNVSKGMLYGNLAAGWFCIFMFVGMFAFSVVLIVQEQKISAIGLIVMSVLYFIPFTLLIVWLYFMVTQEINTVFCDWTIHLDKNEVRFDLRCKKRRKTIVIPREKIIEAAMNVDTKGFRKIRFGLFPEFLWCRESVGGHVLLDDGTKQFLPLGSVDQRRMREVTQWMLAMFNGFLATHPRSAG